MSNKHFNCLSFTCFGRLQHGLHREVAGLDVASLLQADDVAAVADNRPLPHHVQDSRLTHGNVALMNAEEFAIMYWLRKC